MKRVVDEVDGILETLHFDEGENTFTIKRSQDVEAVVEDVSAKHSQTLGKTTMGWHIGSIPLTVMAEYAQSRGIANMWDLCKPEYAAEMVRLCTDSDYRKFSPTGGKA